MGDIKKAMIEVNADSAAEFSRIAKERGLLESTLFESLLAGDKEQRDNDREARLAEWDKFVQQGIEASRHLPSGHDVTIDRDAMTRDTTILNEHRPE